MPLDVFVLSQANRTSRPVKTPPHTPSNRPEPDGGCDGWALTAFSRYCPGFIGSARWASMVEFRSAMNDSNCVRRSGG